MIESFTAMKMSALARELEGQGHDVVHFELGDPVFKTPEVISQAAIEAIRSGATHYTHTLGLSTLREAICQHYKRRFGIVLSPDQILITSGASQALLFAMLGFLASGDEVIVPTPAYPSYANCIRVARGTPVAVSAREEEGFSVDLKAIANAIGLQTKAILINSPSNPTGRTLRVPEFETLAGFRHQYIMADEIYNELIYEEEGHSILEFTDRAFVINGFSKAYAMTGWRLGYLIFPQECATAIRSVQENFAISTNSFVQEAGLVALTSAQQEIADMKAIYCSNRQLMLERLRDIGFGIKHAPEGAFYLFADARMFCDDTYAEALRLLREIQVCVTPGVDFGQEWRNYIRFSFCNSSAEIEKGLNRIAAFYKET